jgi:hypothetical protein
VVQPAEQQQVLTAGEVVVDRRELPGEPDAAAHLLRVLHNIDAQHLGAPPVRLQQSGEHAHGRRLACTVGAQETQHAALGHRQVEAVQGARLTEGLDQALCDNRVHKRQPTWCVRHESSQFPRQRTAGRSGNRHVASNG